MTDYEMDSHPQTTASAYPQADVAFCAGFRTPGSREPRHDEVAGGRKAPRHEVAGDWAPAGSEGYGDLMAASSLMIGLTLTGCDVRVWLYGRSAECDRPFGWCLEGIKM